MSALAAVAPSADDDVRLHRLDLAFDPLVAGVDLALRRGLVQAALAAQLPFEMLDGIGDVEMLAVDAGGLERLIEQPPRRTHERQSLLIFLVARLLADEHHARVRVAGAEYRLRGVRPERAILAAPRGLPKLVEGQLGHRVLECPA